MTDKQLTKEQAAIIGLYTGRLCGPFSDVHELAERLLGESILTHQFADKAFAEVLREKSKPLFLELCYHHRN